MWQQSVQTNWNPENFSPVCATLFLSPLWCTLLFIYSLARRLNWKLKQQSVRNSILRLGVGFWIFQYKYERERATSETENLYFKLTLTQYFRHQLSFEWNIFFQSKRYGWFNQIWLAEKLDRDWNLWTWFGKTYFVEINLSSVKGSGFEILINWLSEAVAGNSWANFLIVVEKNSSGERWQKQFLSEPNRRCAAMT